MDAIWRNEWIQDFETPWSIFEKLSFANRIEGDDILRILGKPEIRAIKNRVIGDKRKKLFELESFDEVSLSNVFGINLIEQNKRSIDMITKPIEYFYGPTESWFSNHLKWCEECLSYAYHSWLHQFILVKDCPYHETPLIDQCPKCHQKIPFILNDKGHERAFMCKCGHSLVDFSLLRWIEWNNRAEIKKESVKKWISYKKTNERWLFIPQYADIELLTVTEPKIKYHFRKLVIKDIDHFFNSRFQKKVYRENKNIFLSIDRYIVNRYLHKHKHCISQFRELRKEEGREFGEICPYAYAYIFWRCTLLSSDRFYLENVRGSDIGQPLRDDLNLVTKAIYREVKYIIIQLYEQLKGIHELSLIWIVNKISAEFSINYFKEWLKKAELGAKTKVVPRKQEIDNMRCACFPKLAFKHYQSTSSNLIEFFKIPNTSIEQEMEEVKLKCPNQSSESQKKIKNMKSYTPQTVVMMVYDRQTEENINLLEYVNQYVSMFRIY